MVLSLFNQSIALTRSAYVLTVMAVTDSCLSRSLIYAGCVFRFPWLSHAPQRCHCTITLAALSATQSLAPSTSALRSQLLSFPTPSSVLRLTSLFRSHDLVLHGTSQLCSSPLLPQCSNQPNSASFGINKLLLLSRKSFVASLSSLSYSSSTYNSPSSSLR
jgi:hypothetical protein